MLLSWKRLSEQFLSNILLVNYFRPILAITMAIPETTKFIVIIQVQYDRYLVHGT